MNTTVYSATINSNTNLKNEIIQHYLTYSGSVNTQYVSNLFILPDCRITIYTSNKILFQGLQAQNEFKKWFNQTITEATINQPTSTTLHTYIGCDETGVGDYLAPLVTCACYLTPEIEQKLKPYRIQDSKQLSDKYIREIAPEIKLIIPHISIVLSNQQYNQLIDKGYNAHAIKAIMHNQTITNLITQSNVPATVDIIMDQFASEKNYRKYLVDITPQYIPTIFTTKAENKYLAVACASIIGRDHFLNKMQTLNQEYQTIFPLGAGSQVDDFSEKFIALHGLKTFKHLVKYHFANTKKIKK